MENRYYAPVIEEFCIGFEYEMKPTDTSWEESRIFIFPATPHNLGKQDPFGFIESAINRDCLRVKYLDRKDIENLKFKLIKTTSSRHVFEFVNDYNLCHGTKTIIELLRSSQSRQVLIKHETYTGYEKQNMYKYVRVKNKLELIKLLKQLDIYASTK